MIKILLLIDYSSEFSRHLLKGLVQYSKDNGPWIFHRLPSYYKVLYGEEGILKWAKEWNADAIIAQWDHEETDILKKLDIPVILQSSETCNAKLSSHANNATGFGKEINHSSNNM